MNPCWQYKGMRQAGVAELISLARWQRQRCYGSALQRDLTNVSIIRMMATATITGRLP